MKYTALTIGPIIKTLSNAKKTKELWASSYLFSYVMKEIIREVGNRKFIVPYVGQDVMDTVTPIGLFHDRFIYVSKTHDEVSHLDDCVDKVVKETAKKLGFEQAYLSQYLQIHYEEYEVDTNPILEISPYLDTLELAYQVAPDGKNFLHEALTKEDNFLKEMCFVSRPFPSLPEIALSDQLGETEANKSRANAIKNYLHKVPEPALSIYENSDYNKEFESYHKYVAIVHADGDNMSKVIKTLHQDEFTDFSKKLFDYCSQSSKLIGEYGGETIFAGGDDLLFFAPVYNRRKNKNIFGLVDDISKVFDNAFVDYNKILTQKGIVEQATLSFGVRVVYYKYPLYEALEESRNLLFDVAKETKNKNNIAFTFSKHAGQTFGSVVDKGASFYEHFSSLVETMTDMENASNFLGSLHHKIHIYQVLIFEACKYHDASRLKNFFINFFKKEHKQYTVFFDQMIAYIYEVYRLDIDDEKEKLQLIYAPLKYVKHIQGDSHEVYDNA